VYIPNVLKPDSDQQNDFFTVFAARDVERIELLQIYDRWGSLVFENRHFQASEPSLGWDGRIRGDAAAPGVYIYIAKVLYVNGISEWLKGDLTVIR
jgi:gliding motility-associated-like protein